MTRPAPILAVLLYLFLAATTVNEVGLVGEVAASWATEAPPDVRVTLGQTERAEAVVEARGSRPQLAINIANMRVPLAVNAYTGGLADWPARVTRALTGSWEAGRASTVLLGALFLALAWRFLRFHATDTAAGAVAFLLATDQGFLFYRKALGGTEVLLHAAGLLVLWALWSRRWKGGIHGTVAIAVGVGLGLHAKATFAATLIAFALTAWLMRWDRAALKPPRRVAWWVLAAIPALAVAPLVANLFLQAAHPELAIRSHDTVGLQLSRWSAPAPAREGWQNLGYFLLSPLAFFPAAYGGASAPSHAILRAIGLAVTVAGSILEWRTRTPTSGAALLRFLSLAVPVQVALLFAANHDLHHLAQATPPLLLLVALAADRVAAEVAPPRSALRGLVTALLIVPHVAAGVLSLRATDTTLAALPRSTFTETGQQELITLLRDSGCATVTTADYEAHGMLDARLPEIRFVHLWGAIANGQRDPEALLREARGTCFLSIRPTVPMVYDWHPSRAAIDRAAAGMVVTPLGAGGWAAIYRIDGPE